MYKQNLCISEEEIVSPHDFSFQLHHYVIYPEIREGDSLVEIVHLQDGPIVKVEICSKGTVDHPALDLIIKAERPLYPEMIEEIKTNIVWHLGLNEDLKPFYSLVRDDPVLNASIAMHYGAKDKPTFSMFEAVIGNICSQNVTFKRLYSMMQNLCERFGDALELEGRTYYAFTRPEQLAEASLAEIRACKVGYRDKLIKDAASSVARGEVDLEHMRALPNEVARKELMKLPGVGPYTADLAILCALGRRDILHLDSFVREVLWRFYFDGQQVSDKELQKFAAERWPGCQAFAAFLLTTNTDTWSKQLGVEFHLRSGART